MPTLHSYMRSYLLLLCEMTSFPSSQCMARPHTYDSTCRRGMGDFATRLVREAYSRPTPITRILPHASRRMQEKNKAFLEACVPSLIRATTLAPPLFKGGVGGMLGPVSSVENRACAGRHTCGWQCTVAARFILVLSHTCFCAGARADDCRWVALLCVHGRNRFQDPQGPPCGPIRRSVTRDQLGGPHGRPYLSQRLGRRPPASRSARRAFSATCFAEPRVDEVGP